MEVGRRGFIFSQNDLTTKFLSGAWGPGQDPGAGERHEKREWGIDVNLQGFENQCISSLEE